MGIASIALALTVGSAPAPPTREVTFQLSIIGRNAENPADDVLVVLTPSDGKSQAGLTDAEGIVRFALVPPGLAKINFGEPSCPPNFSTITVDESIGTVRFSFHRSAKVHVAVSTPSSSGRGTLPLAGARVSFKTDPRQANIGQPTDASGGVTACVDAGIPLDVRVEFDGLVPASRHVEALASGSTSDLSVELVQWQLER